MFYKKKIFVLIVFFLQIHFLEAKYLYPLQEKPGLAATFGEYRSGHYHAGLDFKVYGKIGSPIYAIADGYVFRVRVSPFGYGKALYQRLNDGRIAVYAHNDRFCDKLEEYVKKRRRVNQAYSLNAYLKKDFLKVKKGDIIAYAGRKGTIHPHLHFEIRDKNNHPLNPLLFDFDKKIKDTRSPKIKRIMLVPLNGESTVNYFPNDFSFDPKKKEKITLIGKIGMEAVFYDQADYFSNVLNPYSINVFLDDSLIYEKKYEKASFSLNDRLDYEYDKRYIQREGRRYFRFYDLDNLNTKKIIDTEKLEKGEHSVKLVISDINGNSRTENISFYTPGKRPFFPEMSRVLERNDSLYLIYRNPERFRLKIKGEYGGEERKFDDFKLFLNRKDSAYVVVIENISQKDPEAVGLFFYDENQVLSKEIWTRISPRFCEKIGEKKARLITREKFLIIELKNRIPHEEDFLIMNYHKKINSFIDKKEERYYFIDYKELLTDYDGRVFLNINGENLLGKNKAFYKAGPTSGQVKIISQDGRSELFIKNNSFFEEKLLIHSIEDCEIEGGLTLESPVYGFHPEFYIVKNKPVVTIKGEMSKNVSICGINGGRVDYLKSDYLEGGYHSEIGELGCYALVRDTVPPEIKMLTRLRNRRIKRKIVFSCEDIGFGYGEDDIYAELDGEKIVLEWDGPKDRLIYWVGPELERGGHCLKIRVSDRAGNICEEEVDFTY